MNVNRIDYSNNFKSRNNIVTKVIKGTLDDKSEVIVKITMDSDKNIKFLERYCFNNEKFLEGKCIGNTRGFKENEVIEFFDELQNIAKDGFNFFKEFTKAMLSK